MFIFRSAVSARLTEARASLACQEACVDAASVGKAWHRCQRRQTRNTGTDVGKARADTIRFPRVSHTEFRYAGVQFAESFNKTL